jgi:hypothetical protein
LECTPGPWPTVDWPAFQGENEALRRNVLLTFPPSWTGTITRVLQSYCGGHLRPLLPNETVPEILTYA